MYGLFCAIGFFGIFAQIICLRELAVVFLGQEMALGVGLAAWLLWCGAGSIYRSAPPANGTAKDSGQYSVPEALRSGTAQGPAAPPANGTAQGPAAPPANGTAQGPAAQVPPSAFSGEGNSLGKLAATVVVMGVTAAPWGLLIRLSKAMLPEGQLPGLVSTALLPFLLLSLPAWLIGRAFVYGVALSKNAPSRIYVWESVGALAGGLFATYFLWGRQNPIEALAAAGLLPVIALAFVRRARTQAWRGLLAGCLVLAGMPWLLEKVEHYSRGAYGVVLQRDSPYQRIEQLRLTDQNLLRLNGVVSGQWPDADAQENRVHWALLAHPRPRAVLALGPGAALSAGEILKHPVRRLDLVELDGALLEVVNPDKPAPDDQRFFRFVTDPRQWVRRSRERYDVIIQSLPEPANASLNRFFSREFFRECRRALKKNGVLAFSIPSSENYLPPEVAYLDAVLLKTVAASFPFVEVIPGGQMRVLASEAPIALDPGLFARRCEARRLANRVVVPSSFFYTLHPARREEILRRLKTLKNVTENSDARPLCFFLFWRVWGSKFASPAQLTGVAAVVLTAGTLLGLLWKRRREGLGRRGAVLAALGFSGMAYEVGLLLVYQVSSGALYDALGLLLAAMMSGLAAGSALSERRPFHGGLWWSALLQAFLALGTAWNTEALTALEGPKALWVCGALLFACGAFVGAAYSFAARGSADKAGALYGVDLWGAALGGFAASMFFIPLAGLKGGFAAAGLILTPLALFIFPLRKRPS